MRAVRAAVVAAAMTGALSACGPSEYTEPEACGVDADIITDAFETRDFEVTEDLGLPLPLDGDAVLQGSQDDTITLCSVSDGDRTLRLAAELIMRSDEAEGRGREIASEPDSFQDQQTVGTADGRGGMAICGQTFVNVSYEDGHRGDSEGVRELTEAFSEAAGCWSES